MLSVKRYRIRSAAVYFRRLSAVLMVRIRRKEILVAI